MDILKAIKDPQFREDVLRGLGETFSRGVAGVAGAPVDIATMAMRPFGYDVPAEQVVGGSEYIGKQMERAGLLSSARNPTAEFLAGMVTPDPMDMAKLGAMAVPVVGKALEGYKIKDTPLGKTYIGEKGSISIMENSPYAPRPNSITEFVVDEKERGKGVGKKILDDVLGQYPPESISASVSSPAALSMLYKKGFRPIANPSSSKEDAIKIMREDSAVTMVIPEGKKSAPRDEAMRIAQANAAKPVSEGGLGLRPDNTPMERAQAMGFYDGWKHGSPNPNITEFDPNIPVKRGTDFGPATFATKSSDNASGYSLNWDSYETVKSANKKVQADIEERNRTIASIPAAFESGDFGEVDRLKSKLDDLWQSENDMYENFLNYKIPSEGSTVYPLMIRSENMPWVEGGRKHYMKVHPEAINEARVSGAPGVRINDVADNAGRFGGLSDVIAVFDPSKIRSRFAAFDPARRYESDLLGAADPRLLGVVGAGTAAGLAANRAQSDEEQRRPVFGYRPDGTPKGTGWLGVLPTADGNVATEYSMQSQAVKVKDKMVDFPTLVPTLTQDEVRLMVNDIIPNRKPIPEEIVQKAIKHAKGRIDQGKSPFLELGEQ